MNPTLTFKHFTLPTGESILLPEDVELKLPANSQLDISQQHFLLYIPWDNKYLANVPASLADLFKSVLPNLHARTTDVHVAVCLPFIHELIHALNQPVDERVAGIALIFHDCGWSQMSDDEIAASLGVQGLVLTHNAKGPKEKHALLGAQITREILNSYPFNLPLTDSQKEIIYQVVLHHDQPELIASGEEIPTEVKVVCDVDHLWSFTHLNFWQDVVRKGVNPQIYLQNLETDLEGYFVTEVGKVKAKTLLLDRQAEVQQWLAYNKN